jgi:hypothetical protein
VWCLIKALLCKVRDGGAFFGGLLCTSLFIYGDEKVYN